MFTPSPALKWKEDDAGRSQSRRPRQNNDCTVRAIAKATGMDYDLAYDLLKSSGRKSHQGFDFTQWVRRHSVINGRLLTWKPLQAVKGQRRETVATFVASHQQGIYILSIANHVMTLIDGVIYDTFESDPSKCVYGYVEVVRGKLQSPPITYVVISNKLYHVNTSPFARHSFDNGIVKLEVISPKSKLEFARWLGDKFVLSGGNS